MNRPAPASHPTRWIGAATAIAVTALAAWIAWGLAGVVIAEPGLPLWDPAAHGLVGVDLARAIRAVHPLAFLDGINTQVVWPFVHSLMLAPAFLAFGDRAIVGDLASSVLYAGTVVAVYAAGLALDPRRGPWIGALAAVLVMLAPIYRFFGTITMLEIPGAFLLACAIAFHARSVRAAPRDGLVVAAGVSTAALFLCKYNYGLLWLIPLAAFESGLLDRERRAALFARLGTAVRDARRIRPFPLFMLCYLAAMILILVTGGTEFVAAGHTISIRSPGNMAYAYLLLLLGWGVVRWRRDPEAARRVWAGLSRRHRLLLLTIGLPLAIWFLVPYPNRVKEFFGFVINREAGAPVGLFDRLLFYPRAFANEYAPHAAVGAVVLVLALIPPWRRHPGRRVSVLLYVALAVGLASEMLHHYQHPRFLFTTAVLIWLRAAETAAGLVDAVLARLIRRDGVREAAWIAALVAILAWSILDAPGFAATRVARRDFQSPVAFAPVVDRVLEEASLGPRRPRLLGAGVRLSSPLLAWQAALHRPEIPRQRVPARMPWLVRGASEAAIADRVRGLVAERARVIAALPEPGCTLYSRGDRDEVWADSVTAERLAATPGVVIESDTVLSAARFRVRVFRW